MAGFIIVGIGVFLLLAQLVPDVGRWIPLIVGLIFIAVFVARREYGFLIPGSIISGVGVGVLLANVVDEPLAGAVMVLSLAGGFLAIWVIGSLMRLPRTSGTPWERELAPYDWGPLIPGGILALIGVVLLTEADVEGVLSWWPLIIIAIGLLIIGQAMLRRRA